MKKISLLVTFVGLVALTSCKKDRTCACTYDDGDTVTTTYTDVKKSQITSDCVSSQTTTYDARNVTSNTGRKKTCELK